MEIYCLYFGIATYPDDGDNIDDLIHRADDAMYKVKTSGGNGVAIAGGKELV